MSNPLLRLVATITEPPPPLAVPTGTGVEEGGDLGTFVSGIINWGLGLVGVVFFVLILAAGFQYATAGGDANKAQAALGTIKNAIIGIIIVGFSWIIANAVLGFVFGQSTGG